MNAFWVTLSASVILILSIASLPLLNNNNANHFTYLLVTNGTIYTSDDTLPFADSMAIRNGRILRVGSYSFTKALTRPWTKELNLDGKIVVPGFIDSHVHFIPGGLQQSKCSFAQTKIVYLGYLITVDEVSANSSKISAMTEWSKPTTLKGLGDQSTQVFEKLKVAMTTTPVLALSDFSQPFVIECDASDLGIGAVLLQNNKPIAFFTRVLARQHQLLPAYEKELTGLVKAIRHWWSYLWGQHFLVRTDHYSLKILLEQKALTPPQQHWLAKILGYTFSVEYGAGRFNAVADALSRRDNDEAMLLAISMPQLSLFDDIRNEQQNSPVVQKLISAIYIGNPSNQWSVKNGLLLYKHRVFLASNSPSIVTVMAALHNQGHEGYQKSPFWITSDFHWTGMKHHIRDLVRACDVCQRHKTETLQPVGLLQPLSVPEQIWSDVSLDFVEGLPISLGKNVIVVVVDRFSKYCCEKYSKYCQTFLYNIFKLHGLPVSMVSDRDVTFTSAFWREIFRLSGTKLFFSLAYCPQSDGQTEVVNRTVEMYLRCFASAHPTKWMDWLSWAEYSYNTSFPSSLKMTPFEVVYGRPPPRLLPYCPGISKLDAVDTALRSLDQILQQLSVAAHRHQKLLPKFYGPYKIEQRIGPVAYKLEFPMGTKLHPVFHVSNLKLFHEGEILVVATVPSSLPEVPSPQHLTVLERRVVRNIPEVLIHWQHTSPAEASWETVSCMLQRFPHFLLEDKRDLEEGSNVSTPLVYQRFTHGRFKAVRK
ncbi:Type I inositol-1,4,5-trisphosphate 5-phosphatase CVP2 [Capsicum annuum]|nr:Type I inositol-1,4,5-trisphosphate 5-phosphatase CVP2 [Capsicum annuum]